MNIVGKSAAPWHLWVVGILALLFTLYGGYDYYMTQTGNREYIDAAMGPMGVDADVALAYYDGFPLWMEFVWAIGVWGAVVAAVLLLLRNRYAYPLFAVSLIAFVVSNAYGLVNPMPGLGDSVVPFVMIGVIFVLMLLFTLYARRMATAGVLR